MDWVSIFVTFVFAVLVVFLILMMHSSEKAWMNMRKDIDRLQSNLDTMGRKTSDFYFRTRNAQISIETRLTRLEKGKDEH